MTQPEAPPATPELDKQSNAIRNGGAHEIGYFLDWLEEQGYVVAKREEDDYGEEILSRTYEPKERLIAGYFQIDMNKIEAERHSLLEYLRSINS